MHNLEILGLIILGIALTAHLPAYWAIKKTGWSGWWFLILYISPLGLVFLWVLAFAKWPSQQPDAAFDRG